MEPNHKQKVLMVHNYYQIPGGEDTVVANEKKLLEDHGHEVVLYTRHNNELKSMNKLQKVSLPFTTIFNLRTYRDIKKIIKEQKIDIVHVHNTLVFISPSVYYAALHCHVPIVQTLHNFRLLCPGATFYRDGNICEDCVTKGLRCAIKHKCYRHNRLQTLWCVINTKIHSITGIYRKISYICLTEFNKEKLLQLKQINKLRVFVKPNFTKGPEEVIPYKERENQYVFVGRLEKLKGVDILLEAWNMLDKHSPKLILCGTGPLEDWCRKYIEINGLDNVELRGYVEHEDVMKIIAKSKALIFPTQCYEGFSMGIIESYACGTPVVGSRIGNPERLICDGETGYLFQKNSAKDLANQISKTENLIDNCRKYYIENFDGEKNYIMLLEIYKKSIRLFEKRRQR